MFSFSVMPRLADTKMGGNEYGNGNDLTFNGVKQGMCYLVNGNDVPDFPFQQITPLKPKH